MPADAWDDLGKPTSGAWGTRWPTSTRYSRTMPASSAYLGHNINSIARLFQFELGKANDLPAVPVPAAAVDLAFPAPGLPLVFGGASAPRSPSVSA